MHVGVWQEERLCKTGGIVSSGQRRSSRLQANELAVTISRHEAVTALLKHFSDTKDVRYLTILQPV